MGKGAGCLVDAGIITADCKLTDIAKKRFIDQLKAELTFGTNNLPIPSLFPCGDPVPPHPHADMLDLENEKKWPDFHKNILGSYEKIACALNLKSDFKLLPICCPVSLGFSLGVKIRLPKFPDDFIPFLIPNPPGLAFKLNILPPPELVAKFPSIPSIPPPLPEFEVPPNIKFPDFNTLFDFSLSYAIGIPKFLAEIVINMPKLALKLPSLPDLMADLCKLAFDSQLFGPIDSSSITQIVATKILTTKVVEMCLITGVGTTLGSSPGGITGGLGRAYAYEPEEDDEDGEQTIRDKIVDYAEKSAGLSWGGGERKQELYAQRLLYVEYTEPTTGPNSDPRALGKDKTIGSLINASSCGMFARACLAAGGASYVYNNKVDISKQDPASKLVLYYDFFQDRYPENKAIAGIIDAAEAKNARIPYNNGDLPALKKGDIIITTQLGTNAGTEHVIVLVKDYEPGSFQLETIEGGQVDRGNKNKPTAIKKKVYEFSNIPQEGKMSIDLNKKLKLSNRYVYVLLDGEKICTSRVGSDMRKSNGPMNEALATDGPGFS